MPLQNVDRVLLVLSGKGGVGKSSVTLQLALALTEQGYNVGILDIDLTGPSIPRLVGKEDAKVKQAAGGWLPVEVYPRTEITENGGATSSDEPIQNTTHNGTSKSTAETSTPSGTSPRGSLHALSLAFLLPSRSSAVIWRGPKKTAMIRQFLSDALWPPNTDFLLVDTPPGTSDEHIAIAEELHKLQSEAPPSPSSPDLLMGAVVVTTPQAISTSDVRKELNFCVKTSIPVLGVIENMAGYICPCCGEVSNIFSKGGGEIMARENNVRFLGGVPVDTGFGQMVEGVFKKGEQQTETGEVVVKTERDERVLVERYLEQCSSLAGVFGGFVKQILAGDETTTTA